MAAGDPGGHFHFRARNAMRTYSRSEVQRLPARKRTTLLILLFVMCGSVLATQL